MAEAPARRILAEMLREEWRLHSRLFGGLRFAAFPLLVLLLVAGSVALVDLAGTGLGVVFLGLHALAFLFGLHTGSVGLVGRDALENLLGEVTLLVFSTRTLPLSSRRLLGIFVVKDVLYYAALFLLPAAVGVAPALGGSPASAATTVAGLWLTMTGMFVLGVATTLAGAGLADQGWAGILLVLGAPAALAWAVLGGIDVAAVTPYGAFVEPSLSRAVASLALIGLLGALAAAVFNPEAGRRTRHADPRLRRWRDRVGDPVAAKTLLDLSRSSGGWGKVLFSGGILLLVTAALVTLAEAITGVSPSAAVTYGAVLGLTAFTTYNWLTRFEDVEEYAAQPLDVDDLFAGKLRAFLVTAPAPLALYAVALAWEGSPPGEAAAGAVLLAGVSLHVLGVTAYLTGFSPHEFLFDTALFAAFGVAVALPLVPVLVLGIGYAPLSATQLAAVAGAGVLMGLVGMGVYGRAAPRWRLRLRG